MNELTKPMANAPSYLAALGQEGIDRTQNFGSTPRIKIMQGMSDADLRKSFPPGSCIIAPQNTLVAAFGETFDAVTAFFWPSWEKWRDLNDAAPMPILESSTDPDSEIARRAKNPGQREEVYPDDIGKKKPRLYRYVEALNFALYILTGPAAGSVAVASFARGGHRRGARLHDYLKRRDCPVWANRVALVVGEETNRDNQTWYQLRHEIAAQPFIGEDDVATMRKLFLDLKAAYDSRTLAVDTANTAEPAAPEGDEAP